jgi:hypothetical protein
MIVLPFPASWYEHVDDPPVAPGDGVGAGTGWGALGVGLGLALGVGLGLALGGELGLALGVGLGLALGVGLRLALGVLSLGVGAPPEGEEFGGGRILRLGEAPISGRST